MINENILTELKQLKQSIEEVSVYDLNVYSSMELYSRVAKKLNEVIQSFDKLGVTVSEAIIEQNNDIQYLLNEGLTTEVVNKINQMVADGTMDTIINQNVFSELNSQIKEIKNEISSNITGSALRDISDGEYFIFSDETTTMSYTITNELSNAKNSNNISSINEGMSYTSTITADDGYTLEAITVTMGGTDITSSSVSGNTITISNVTGNIVITVTTTQNSQEPGGETQEIVSTGLIKSLNDITDIQSIDNADATYFDLNNSEFTVFARCSRLSTSVNPATSLGGSTHPLTLQITWQGVLTVTLLRTLDGNNNYPTVSINIDTTLYDEVGENLFIAIVGNKSTMEFYINNIKQSSTLFYGEGTYTPPTSILVGGNDKKVTWLYYNRTLSSDELTQNYTALGGVL